MIKLEKFVNKTPQQTLNFLRRYGFKKSYVIDCLEYSGDLEPNDEKLTMLQLCEKYNDEILDCVWDDITSA